MIGDISKHTTREQRRIGSVKNRPIEVLPYEKGIDKDLTLSFKANNYNDREITIKETEYIDNKPFGYLPNIISNVEDGNLILDFADNGYNHIVLDKDIFINNILNIENGAEYTLVFEQNSVGGHSVMIDTDNINLYLSNELSLDDIGKNPNGITIINLTCVFGDLYGEINYLNTNDFSNVVSTSFDFDINVTTASLDFTLPIQDGEDNYKHDFVVDWGDNTTSEVKSFDASGATHTYAVEGDYNVKITGVCEYFAFNNEGDRLKLIQLNSFNGDCGFKFLNFYGCTNLAGEIPKSFTNLHKLETAERLFQNCTNLTGEIPENMFWNCPNINSFIAVFASSLISAPMKLSGNIPEKLFWNNPLVDDFTASFQLCTQLTGSIPEKLFWNNPLVTNFSFTFRSCTNLTGNIPEKLFINNPLVTNFQQTFRSCINLTGSIPEKLFINNPLVINFQQTFSSCTNLSGSIPENLFWNNPLVTNFSFIFYQCTNLTGSIPEKLFINNPLVTTFQQAFQQCTGLTDDLPHNLFINNKEVRLFTYTFWGSNNLTGRGWETIINEAEQNAIDGGFTLTRTQCFRNCTSLTDYAQIPAAWR